MTPGGQQPIPQTDPVTKFLGPASSVHGPFGVLGLPVADVSEEDVLDALHRVMVKIDAHRESATPAADEARLAAHAAAANLIDDAVRHELLRRLGATPAPPAGARPPAVVPRPDGRPSPATLQADLLRCIATAGGWNVRAMQHFVKIAHERGFRTDEAIHAINMLEKPAASPPAPTLASQRPTPPASPPRPQPPQQPVRPPEPTGPETAARAAPEPMREPPPSGGISPFAAVFLTIVVFVVLAASGWLAWTLTREPPPPPPVHSSTPAPPPEPEAEAPPPAPIETRRPLDSAPAIIHELEVATDAATIDPDAALDTFALAVGALSDRWTGFSPGDLLAAHDQVIGFLYRVGGRTSSIERAMQAIESGAGAILDGAFEQPRDISRAAWSVGMLVRLRREQNLPGTIMRRIDATLLRIPGGLSPNASTFRAGAVAALRSIASVLSRPPLPDSARRAWDAWPGVARAAAGGDDALEESLLINALEGLLRLHEPGVAADEIASSIVADLNWRPGGAARVWLVRAFDDRTLDTADLHVVTLALATVSKAEGVDHSMVLPRDASEFDRRRLRDLFREKWDLAASGDQGDTVAAFAAAAREALLHRPTENRDEGEKLAAVVRIARLNAAGALAWRARNDAAAALLDTLDDPITAVLDSKTEADASSLFTPDTGTWAETYLAAKSHIPRRTELLEKLSARRGELGPMEAEVLVNEALRGSPRQVRDRAAGVAEMFIDQPTVVNAVLEALPLMPRTNRNAKIVELAAGASLPRVDAPDWAAQARRAVVERLLELIAGHGLYARLDALATLLDEAYDITRNGPPGSGVSSAGSGAPPARISAKALFKRWADLASRRPPAGLEGYSVDEIERRRQARLAMADGLVQRFHTEQLALAELMAQVIASEQPGATPRIARMLDDLRLERGRDRNILLQIERTERLMLELRLIRFGQDTGGGNG